MEKSKSERIFEEARRSTTLAKLEAMARELTGGALKVLLCKDDQLLKLTLNGHNAALPNFCKLMRGTPGGTKRCTTCRSLVALRASYQGLTEYSCHGGICVLAAPAVTASRDNDEFVVVSSCAFAEADQDKGWKAARSHAQGLPINMRELRKAYYELPVLTKEKQALARSIVDTAAAAIQEISRFASQVADPDASPCNTEPPQEQVERLLGSAFAKARTEEACPQDAEPGSALADIVQAVVSRNPAMPFSVANLARAANMTPNHFSMLFRRHTGTTFMAFLTGRRIALAQDLLRDPAISVGEAARRAGFTDTNYFSRRFRQATGTTPSNWRRSRQL